MNGFKSHFAFNRSQRNGIFILPFFIIGLQLLYFFVDFYSEEPISPAQQEELGHFRQ